MSQENIDVVREYAERHGGMVPKDTPKFVARFWDPDGDYYPVRKFPEARPCHGLDEIARFQAEYVEAWDRYEISITKLIAVGDDRVFVQTIVDAEGRESGVRLDGDLYHCAWLRHGRIFRWEDHLTLRGALRALGLSGEDLEAAETWLSDSSFAALLLSREGRRGQRASTLLLFVGSGRESRRL